MKRVMVMFVGMGKNFGGFAGILFYGFESRKQKMFKTVSD